MQVDDVTVTGRVVDRAGNGIAGARVTAEPLDLNGPVDGDLDLLASKAIQAVADDGGQYLHPAAFLERHHGLDDTLHALRRDGGATAVAEGRADAGVEHAHVVVDLRDRAHGRAAAPGHGLLGDGY